MAKYNIALTTLLKRKEQLEAKIQTVQAKESTQQRKDDTRRKILVGAYVLEKHQKSNTFDKLIAELNVFLLKPNDRTLFGLTSKEENMLPATKNPNHG